MSYIFLDESGVNKQEGISSVILVYMEPAELEKLQKVVLHMKENFGMKKFHWASHSLGVQISVRTSRIKAGFYDQGRYY